MAWLHSAMQSGLKEGETTHLSAPQGEAAAAQGLARHTPPPHSWPSGHGSAALHSGSHWALKSGAMRQRGLPSAAVHGFRPGPHGSSMLRRRRGWDW